jgi:hypothetical protein
VTPGTQRRWAISIGANYRLAPGLDLVAEWTHHETKQPGVSQNTPVGNIVPTSPTGVATAGLNNTLDRARASVFITGVRLAF